MNDMIHKADLTIPAVFDAAAAKRPAHSAIIYLGTHYSYLKVETLAAAFAVALQDNGLKPGQRVIIYVPNSIQWVIAWLGILRAGGVCVPITPIYTPRDITYIANDSAAEVIVCTDTNFGYVKKVLPQTRLEQVIITKMAELLPAWKRLYGFIFDIIPKGKIALEENTLAMGNMLARYAGQTAMPPKSCTGSDLAEILYTGGTTRHPKGVPITHDLFLLCADEQIRVSDPLFPVEDNVVMGSAPLFHVLGQTCGLAAILAGGTLILQPKVNLDATFESIRRFRARTMIGVPALYRMILEHDRLHQYDMSSVDFWFSAGDVLPVEVGRRWLEKFGKPVFQGYGATETCGGVAMCPADIENPPKSIGRIVNSKSVQIVNPATLKPVAQGQAGELIVTSKPMVTRYINKPEETASAFIELDGRTWYRTADVVSMDKDGNLYFVDRTVDTIKHKGYRVSASEIEAVLQENSSVVASCVVGVPDEKTGERIKAFVVLKADIKGVTSYELIKWCRKALPSYKIPQYIEFRDMLPKSKVGKLLRREVRDEERRMKAQ